MKETLTKGLESINTIEGCNELLINTGTRNQVTCVLFAKGEARSSYPIPELVPKKRFIHETKNSPVKPDRGEGSGENSWVNTAMPGKFGSIANSFYPKQHGDHLLIKALSFHETMALALRDSRDHRRYLLQPALDGPG